MKAILVIDVEEKDIGRKVNYVSIQGGGLSYIVGAMGEDVRLRPLPDKQENQSWADDYTRGFMAGFNTFRYLITGETE